MKIDILPKQIVKEINWIDIFKVDISLNNSARVFVRDAYNEETVIVIEEDEYKQWGDNDEYLINLVCKKLDIQKI